MRFDLWIPAGLVLATLAVYAPAFRFDFVNFDDPDYVTTNAHVRSGLTVEGIGWAFTSNDAANWFPLTRLSHMLDVQLFGFNAGLHHLVNAVIHALAAVLLFSLLHRATKALWPSAFVAFVFALHPLHVESVAWISERKDVLSAFFWFLTLLAYVRYTERPKLSRYVLVMVAFILGLLSKPMIVTLPLVLLLLDYWPLRRSAGIRQLVYEKLPLFALSALLGLVTYLVQQQAGAMEALHIPLGRRVGNGLVSYVLYIKQTLWPSSLAVFYPYQKFGWQSVIASVILASLSILVIRQFRKRPYLPVGWFWYIATLLPVIGFIQVGAQAHADRYTYVPTIGLSIMLAWSAAEVLTRWPQAKPAIVALACLVCIACIPATSRQIGYWENSGTLFEHTLAVTDRNYIAEHNLGTFLMDVPGRLPDAVKHLEAALEIEPGSVKARTDLATALAHIPGRLPDSIKEYQDALKTSSNSAIPHNNLANTLAKAGRLPEAIAEYEIALKIEPNYTEAKTNLSIAHSSLGDLFVKQGRLHEAVSNYEVALRIRPDYAEAHNNLGVILSKGVERLPQAISHFEAAIRLQPDYADAHYNRGVALSQMPGKMPLAISEFETALRLKPDPELRALVNRLKVGKY